MIDGVRFRGRTRPPDTVKDNRPRPGETARVEGREESASDTQTSIVTYLCWSLWCSTNSYKGTSFTKSFHSTEGHIDQSVGLTDPGPRRRDLGGFVLNLYP